MSYTPQLLIRKSQLDAHKDELIEKYWKFEKYKGAELTSDQRENNKIIKFDAYELIKKLLEQEKADAVFPEIELMHCHPELTKLNQAVRSILYDLGIEFATLY